jgi:hypothetical protein
MDGCNKQQYFSAYYSGISGYCGDVFVEKICLEYHYYYYYYYLTTTTTMEVSLPITNAWKCYIQPPTSDTHAQLL